MQHARGENRDPARRRRGAVRRAAGFVALAGAVALAGLAVAQIDTEKDHQAAQSAAAARAEAVGDLAATTNLSGMIVVRDPESGEYRAPSPAEASRLRAETAALFGQSAEGLEAERMANGGWRMDLQGRFQNATVAVGGAQGQLAVVCAEHPDQVAGAAHDALHGAAGHLDANGLETR